jgi:MFS transporter, DHA1 family, multidrug resistance protein
MPPETPFRATSPVSIVMLTLMAALGQMSVSLYLPSMPRMTEALDTSMGMVQLTLTVFFAGFAASQLLVGPVSDRLGRRPVLLLGLLVFMVASLACMLSVSVSQLIAARFFQAFGACTAQALSRAVVRDTTEGAESVRAMSLIAAVMSLSPAITPTIGAQLQVHFGWRANFALLLLVGTALALLCAFMMPETNRRKDRHATDPSRMLANYCRVLTDRAFFGYGIALGCVYAALYSFQTGSPHLLMVLVGHSPESYGLLSLLNVLGFLVGSLMAARLSNRLGTYWLVRLGCLMILVAGFALLVPPLLGHLSTVAIIGPVMLFMCGAGILLPAAMSGALERYSHMAGTASAMLGFMQMALAFAGSLLVSLLQDMHVHAMPAVFAALSVLCFLLGISVHRPRPG